MRWIGLFCFLMAAVCATTSVHDYRPDPWLDALVWFGVGVWIFVVGWDVAKRMR